MLPKMIWQGRRMSWLSRASRVRSVLLVFLAISYVLVSVGGEISCAEETLEAANGATLVTGTADNPEEGSKKATPVVDHCYTCIPIVLPAPLLVAVPSADPVEVSFATPTFWLEDHPGLDTPPPKHQT
jgi:hypothetical protein